MLAVLDIGKTHSRILVLDEEGRQHAAQTRVNHVQRTDRRQSLDADAIEHWLLASLSALSRRFAIGSIIPVAHGAAAALIENGKRAALVLDYECAIPDDVAEAYDALRDPFTRTFSPRLPLGLNLGAQLFWQERLYPEIWPGRAEALLWPQYWAWKLCGVHASEVTSLGCHTDLWLPHERDYSPLAKARGWRFGPLRAADDVLGTAAGLGKSCEVLCGVHDSNAALLAARGFPEVEGRPFALVSTGTWFVAMQSGVDTPRTLDPSRDTLANVDTGGVAVPSARFMGGREYEHILVDKLGAKGSVAAALRLVDRDVMTEPSFVTGCGPFPGSRGTIHGDVRDDEERAALAGLHLALMSDQSLGCIAAEGPIVIEGRFSADDVYVRALAALRLEQPVFCSALADGVALGAARLRIPNLKPNGPLHRVAPLSADLAAYRSRWLARISRH
jgi:sugar (pentulose or hexulose) kinase